MVAELVYAGDPSDSGANPGTSDNLAQRNLVILETANPGTLATHCVQHSFDVVLASRAELAQANEHIRLAALQERQRLEAERGDPQLGGGERSVAAWDRPQGGDAAADDPLITRFVEQTSRTGLDELAVFWNDLPAGSQVEITYRTSTSGT